MIAAAKNFRGTSYHSTDEKARIVLPARFRDVVKASEIDGVVVSRLDGSLVAYPFNEWQVIEDRIMARVEKDEYTRRLRRFFIGGAHECMCDKQGRILIPPALREYAEIGPKKDVVLVGVVNHFEVWSRTAYEMEYEAFEHDMKSGRMGEEVAKLGL
ncbi:MAG: division/cell wall cluster transcriptional repressor MraZ [Desulfatibacillum sp.]|nr:division/cell wall cluster transcriptional repressor MraZ [Desulfatibacillum sp.]